MLSSDRPIASEEDDVLGFSQFAESLARSLTEMAPEEGIAVSIEGAWGSGKTSALGLIERRLIARELAHETGDVVEGPLKQAWSEVEIRWDSIKETRRTHVIRFNPWNFSGQENLVRAFFLEVGAAIGHSENGAISSAIKKITSYLPSVGLVAGGTGALATGGVAAFGVGSAAGRAIGEGIQTFASKSSSLESLKRDLATALKEAKKRIIIIIDDIDRLMPSEMRSIFSLVKSLGDLPNVLYVLSFDRAVVTKAMSSGVDAIDSDFLEKIIQVQIKLPPPWRAEIRSLFFQRLNSVIGDAEPNNLDRWQTAFYQTIEPYIRTPRDVSRIHNAMQVIWPNVSGDVDLTDLLILTTLQLFEPAVYEKIFENIEELSGETWHFEKDEEFAARYEPVGANNPDTAKEALAHIFPSLAKGWKKHVGDIAYIKKREHRRLCTKEYYRNYFLFGRDPSRQSKASLENLLAARDVRQQLPAFLREIASKSDAMRKSPVANFLEQIFETVHVKPLLTDDALAALLDISDELIERSDRVWEFFVEDNLSRLESIMVFGLEPLGKEDRSRRVSLLSRHPKGLAIASNVILRLAGQHGLYGGTAAYEEDRYISHDEAVEAASIIADRIQNSAENGELLRLVRSLRIIFIWKSIVGLDPVREWLSKEIEADEFVLRLAQILPSVSYQTRGSVRSEVRSFNAETFAEILDVEQFKMRLAAVVVATDTEQAIAIQREFLEAEEIGRQS